jgi:hypothetical protein
MARSKRLTKTIAITPKVHEKLLALQEAYKLPTLNDTLDKALSEVDIMETVSPYGAD